MKRFSFMLAAGAIGLAFLTGAAREVAASGPQPLTTTDGRRCYLNGAFCSYVEDDYWSNCYAPGFQGYITTEAAKGVCTVYHSS